MVTVAIMIVAVLHVAFFAMESIFWTTPTVRRVFQNTAQKAEDTRVLALNQGAYNLGLAILLLWLHLRWQPDRCSGGLALYRGHGVGGWFLGKSGHHRHSVPTGGRGLRLGLDGCLT